MITILFTLIALFAIATPMALSLRPHSCVAFPGAEVCSLDAALAIVARMGSDDGLFFRVHQYMGKKVDPIIFERFDDLQSATIECDSRGGASNGFTVWAHDNCSSTRVW